MNANKIRIIALGNMSGSGDLMIKPGTKNEPEKIFVRKGETTLFHKLLDKIRNIKTAPYSIKVSLEKIGIESRQALKNVKSNPDEYKGYQQTTYSIFEGVDNPSTTESAPIIFSSKSAVEIAKTETQKLSFFIATDSSIINNNDEKSENPASTSQELQTKIKKTMIEVNDKFKTLQLRREDKKEIISQINKTVPFDKLVLSNDHENRQMLKEKISDLRLSIEFFAASAVQDNSQEKTNITDSKLHSLKNELINDFNEACRLVADNPDKAMEFSTALNSLDITLNNILNNRDKNN